MTLNFSCTGNSNFARKIVQTTPKNNQSFIPPVMCQENAISAIVIIYFVFIWSAMFAEQCTKNQQWYIWSEGAFNLP